MRQDRRELNGFDWVLERIIADINLSNKDIYIKWRRRLLKKLLKTIS